MAKHYDAICTFNLQDCIRALGLEERGRVQRFVTNAVMELSDPYVPFDEAGLYPLPGRLRQSVHIEDGTDVVWNTPYARRWYYEKANFQGAPLRGNYWVDRMLQNGGLKKIEDGARREAAK